MQGAELWIAKEVKRWSRGPRSHRTKKELFLNMEVTFMFADRKEGDSRKDEFEK